MSLPKKKREKYVFFEAFSDPNSNKFIIKETPKRSEMIDICPHVQTLTKDPSTPMLNCVSSLKEMCARAITEHNLTLQPLPIDLRDSHKYIIGGHNCKLCDKKFFSECCEPLCRELKHCVRCPLTDSMWLCMTCGHFACGRVVPDEKKLPFFQGGNGHALEHYDKTGHPVVCKLKAIDKTYADVYCYKCEESVFDPNLAGHLANLGIDLDTLPKTEDSLEELDERTKAPLRDQIRNNPNFIFIPASSYYEYQHGEVN